MCQLNLLKKNKVIGKKQVIGRAIGCISAINVAQYCSTEADMWDHEGDLSSCWSYTMVSGEKYWVKDGEYWVVDVPAQAAQPEQGHWEYR